VIKNLGRLYREVQMVSGATILGNGTVALILDPHRLVQAAGQTSRQKHADGRQVRRKVFDRAPAETASFERIQA
jgi:two-component system chemotaxis sensor kinase CheA